MTVIVKGMKMPNDCFECDLQNPFVEEPYCRRLLKRCPKTGRLEDCPLAEVPTPHGRLMDCDRAISELANCDMPAEAEHYGIDEAIAKYLNDEPTVIEAEE